MSDICTVMLDLFFSRQKVFSQMQFDADVDNIVT
jgi:hypothetical protein